jgi:hypothetical protein
VLSRVPRSLPRLAALAGSVSVLAACSFGGGTSPAGAGAPPAAQQLTPKKAILLAATKAQRVTSFEASVAFSISMPGSGPVQMAGTMAEQLSPSLRAKINFSTFQVPGTSQRASLSEVVTAKAIYINAATVGQAFHVTKPWLEIPVSAISKSSGIDFSSLFSQAQNSNPLSQTEMLTASPDVHKAGTATVNGVPVTEYAGTYSMAKALAALPAASRDSMSKQITGMGVKTAKFRVWLDGQQQVRKLSVTLTSSKLTETVTETITSVNQPVSITLPPAAQTSVIPAALLGS